MRAEVFSPLGHANYRPALGVTVSPVFRLFMAVHHTLPLSEQRMMHRAFNKVIFNTFTHWHTALLDLPQTLGECPTSLRNLTHRRGHICRPRLIKLEARLLRFLCTTLNHGAIGPLNCLTSVSFCACLIISSELSPGFTSAVSV